MKSDLFNPVTAILERISDFYSYRIKEVEGVFDKDTIVYIDLSNILYVQNRLGFRIDLKRLKQFLDSFVKMKEAKLYNGELLGDADSEGITARARGKGYTVITKPVKIIRIPINSSSISVSSTEILKRFIKSSFLRKLKVENIEYLNARLREMNNEKVYYLEERKCNFDVEIGLDMLMDFHNQKAENFVLWSGDSDFFDPIEKLLVEGKKVTLFFTSGKVAHELNELKSKGLRIFDIKKIRDFICYKKHMKNEF